MHQLHKLAEKKSCTEQMKKNTVCSLAYLSKGKYFIHYTSFYLVLTVSALRARKTA